VPPLCNRRKGHHVRRKLLSRCLLDSTHRLLYRYSDCLAQPGIDCWISTKEAMRTDIPWEAFTFLVAYDCGSPFIEPLELQALLSQQQITEACIMPVWQERAANDEFVNAWCHIVRYPLVQ
jgi:hypothetical protein